MKIKTSELTDAALDCAVAKCLTLEGRNQGFTVIDGQPYVVGRDGGNGGLSGAFFSRDWSQGGPIIDLVIRSLEFEEGGWRALCWGMDGPNRELYSMRGPTPLVAAMRCYVASTLGPEVEVPDELLA